MEVWELLKSQWKPRSYELTDPRWLRDEPRADRKRPDPVGPGRRWTCSTCAGPRPRAGVNRQTGKGRGPEAGRKRNRACGPSMHGRPASLEPGGISQARVRRGSGQHVHASLVHSRHLSSLSHRLSGHLAARSFSSRRRRGHRRNPRATRVLKRSEFIMRTAGGRPPDGVGLDWPRPLLFSSSTWPE
jgi:hypothetical protein